jgi:hypothetical protein
MDRMDATSDDKTTLLTRLQRLDEARPSLPAEHWMVLGLGAWMLLRRRDSVLGRLASMAVGGALVWRAMSGRDGIAKRLRTDSAAFQPTQPGEPFHDVAAPWPYDERTRVSEPHALP